MIEFKDVHVSYEASAPILKGVSFATPAGWVPAFLSCGAVVLLHLWKGNDLLSIFGGTILYMALVQGVFG